LPATGEKIGSVATSVPGGTTVTTSNPQPESGTAYGNALSIERNGINVIGEGERKGTPRDLFWPWCAANISVLGLSYAAFVLYFGLSFWQALVASVIGTIVSFFLVGLVSLAGKRGSAPTMALSRAAFGVRGNILPSAVSYLVLVGWETVLVALSTLATATVFEQLGWSSGDVTKVIAFLIVAALIVIAGVLGFELIMQLQRWLTYITVLMTVVYIALTVDELDWNKVSDLESGNWKAQVGALIFMMTAFGLSWVNSAADYSRYLPRNASSGGVVGWTTFGGAVAPVILVVYGLLLIGSRQDLIGPIAGDPIGTLATLLPDWFLLIYVVVAVLGLVAGAVLDIYSSGLTLLSLGAPLPRWGAALLDGVIMILGTIYIVWIADDFLGPFQGFLITLGVPLASWCGIFLADLALRRRDYDDVALFDPEGRYGAVNPISVGLLLVSTVVGWGLVVGTVKQFDWEGYLLDPLGLGGKDGAWAFANLGIAFALLFSFAGYYLLCAERVRSQEAAAPESSVISS
jgi:nucleobase:cation symporter-1, NCS1 family